MLLLDPRTLDQLTEKPSAATSQPHADLKRLLNLLSDKDRVLVEMAMKHGLSRRQMAVILGLTPGTITRKIRRVIDRLNDPLIAALADPICTLSPEHRQIAIEYFLHRHSVADLARLHALSRNEVRTMLDYVRGWHRGITSRR
jgi:DNA-directed RNA polymerase specialized sigma24 family protein